MEIEFPILTIPSKGVSTYLQKLEELVNIDFSECVILSPFVDAHIIVNFIKRCVFNEKRVFIFSRYRSANEMQKRGMDKARKLIFQYQNKDPTLNERVVWKINEKLHAKCVIMEWSILLFGSQNLTQYGGLGYRERGNYELGMLIRNLGEKEIKSLKEFVKEIDRTSSMTFYPRNKNLI